MWTVLRQSDLTPEQLKKLVARVAAEGDAHRGELVFRRADVGCAKCHALSGAGGNVGPDLSAVGANSPPDYMITSLLDPDLNIKEVYVTRQFLMDDGHVYSGIVVDRDDQRVVLRDATGKQTTLATADIDNEGKGKSLMPKGLVGLLTDQEFIDLVRFLADVGKPGPLAIRSQQSVQRWEFLKSTPADLTIPTVSSPIVKNQLSAAQPDEWQTIYGLVNGDLPLKEVYGPERPLVYLRAAVEATRPGPVSINFDDKKGTRLWIDGVEIHGPNTSLTRGKHELVVRIDPAERQKPTLRLVVGRPTGTTAEFTTVGGP